MESKTNLDALLMRLRSVKSWSVPEEVQFRNYAIGDGLFTSGIPSFTRSEHCDKAYVGFVRQLIIYPPSLSIGFDTSPTEDADFAYIENGVIRYTVKGRVVDFDSSTPVMVSTFRDGNFYVEEKHTDLPPMESGILERMSTGSIRRAEFLDGDLSVSTSLDHKGRLTFRLNRADSPYTNTLVVHLEREHPAYQPVLNRMQAEPCLFSDRWKVEELCVGLPVDNRSRVCRGVKNWSDEGYHQHNKLAHDTLLFGEAMKIAFPTKLSLSL